MKLKILLKEIAEIPPEEDEEGVDQKLKSLKAIIHHETKTEREILKSYYKNKDNPQEFLKSLQEMISNISNDLNQFKSTFPFLDPLLKTLDQIAAAGEKDIKRQRRHSRKDPEFYTRRQSRKDPDFYTRRQHKKELFEIAGALEGKKIKKLIKKMKDLGDSAPEEVKNILNIIQRLEKQQKEKQVAQTLQNIDLSNFKNILDNAQLDAVTQKLKKDISSGIETLRKNKKDPIDFFDEHVGLIDSMRSIYQIINLLNKIEKIVKNANYNISRQDAIEISQRMKTDPDAIEDIFKLEFKDLNLTSILNNGRRDFNAFFINKLFINSDIVRGGSAAASGAAIDKAAAWAIGQSIKENNIEYELSSLIKEDYTKLINKSNNLIYVHPITYDLLRKLTIKFKDNIDYNINKLNENILNNNKYNLIVSQIDNLVKNYSKKDKKKLQNFNENKNLRINSKLSPDTIQFILSTTKAAPLRKLLKEECTIKNHSDQDMSHLENILTQFYPYAQKRLKFEKPVSINLVSDEENSKDPFGKTAYYNPETMEISIFVDDRHPKDMLRSIAHELVHHSQNCKGEFDNVKATEPGYAQKDPHLRHLEGEAYLLGNGFLVRDFEDMLKNLKEN